MIRHQQDLYLLLEPKVVRLEICTYVRLGVGVW